MQFFQVLARASTFLTIKCLSIENENEVKMKEKQDDLEEKKDISEVKKEEPTTMELVQTQEELEKVREDNRKSNKDYFQGGFTGLIFGLAIALLVFTVGIYTGKIAIVKTVTTSDNESVYDNASAYVQKLQVLEQVVGDAYLKGDEVKTDKLIENIYKGFINGLGDKYSAYYTAEEYNKLVKNSEGKYIGIGAIVIQDTDTMEITVGKIEEGSTSEEAGLRSGDIIKKVSREDVAGKSFDDAINSISSAKDGETVVITVLRGTDTLDIPVVCKLMENKTVESEMKEGNIGYIYVSEFDEITIEQFKTALASLTAQGMKGLVIDLRDNPGGLYDAVVDMLDQILPEGLLVYTEDKNGNVNEKYSDEENKITIPYSVIINENSASASEIFAGAVKDFGIGKIVGTTSYGKGIVQEVYPLSDGSALKLTIASYFTPKGISINGVGVKPDVEIDIPDSVYESGELTDENDTQLKAAIEALGIK